MLAFERNFHQLLFKRSLHSATFDGVVMTRASCSSYLRDPPFARVFYLINPQKSDSEVFLAVTRILTHVYVCVSFYVSHMCTCGSSRPKEGIGSSRAELLAVVGPVAFSCWK